MNGGWVGEVELLKPMKPINTMETRQVQEEEARAALKREQIAHAVTRAGAEQARRHADCVRAALDALLLHTEQPLAVLDRNGVVTQWNTGMAALCGIEEAQAAGETLPRLLRLPPGSALAQALRGLDPAATYTPQSARPRILNGPIALRPSLIARRITLIPLCLVPGTLESLIVLVEAEH